MSVRVSIARIKAVTAADFGVPPVAMDTHRRFKKYVLPRQAAMYLACSLTDLSFPSIAKRFADRDHTTVYHAFKKIAALRSMDRALDQRLLRLEETLSKRVAPPRPEVQLGFLIGPLFDLTPSFPRPTLRRLEAA